MNQTFPQLQYFAKAFLKGLLIGALASLAIYGSIRLLFLGVSFTTSEEIMNVLKIVFTGGSITGFAVIAFLLIESAIVYSKSTKLKLSPVFIKKMSTAALVIFAFGYLLKWMM